MIKQQSQARHNKQKIGDVIHVSHMCPSCTTVQLKHSKASYAEVECFFIAITWCTTSICALNVHIADARSATRKRN